MNFTLVMNDELDKSMKKIITKASLMDKYNEMIEYEDEMDDEAARNLKIKIVDYLKANNIECSVNDDSNTLKESIQKMKSNQEIIKDLIYYYYDLYDKTPTYSEILDNIVEKLVDEDLKEEGVGTKALIVRQFIKNLKDKRNQTLNFLKKIYPDKLSKYKKNDIQQYMSYINDEMFGKYNEEKLKNKKIKVDWLDLANNLYEAYFQSNGKARSNLYLFGLVFKMKYYHRYDPKFENIDSFEKQLLFNYYTDNMKRYISAEYKNLISHSEHEPSALGVNFKNYLEFIYVYFMNKTEMDVQTKYNKINDCLKVCNDRLIEDYKNRNVNSVCRMNHTIGFGEAIKRLSMEESNLVKYICENYPLQQYKDNNNDKTTLNSLSVSALEFIKEKPDMNRDLKIIKNWEIEELNYRRNLKIDIDKKDEEGNYILSEKERKNLERMIKISKKISENNNYAEFGFLPILYRNEYEYADILADTKFIEILKKMESILDVRRLNAELSLDKISRTSFVTRAFYDFIGDGLLMEKPYSSLESLYEDFCENWNYALDTCRYQCINSKNLYDMYLIYSAYLYLCLSE